jgi:hypothetical protein
MEPSDLDDLDGNLETEREWLVSSLRRIADRIESLALEDVIEPLTHLAVEAAAFVSHADTLLRSSRGTSPAQKP